MKTYEYEMIKMEPVEMDCDAVLDILNDRGAQGYRFFDIQKLWAQAMAMLPSSQRK